MQRMSGQRQMADASGGSISGTMKAQATHPAARRGHCDPGAPMIRAANHDARLLSSFGKYSAGVWGCKTPTAPAATRSRA
jgi:hypothetical protein